MKDNNYLYTDANLGILALIIVRQWEGKAVQRALYTFRKSRQMPRFVHVMEDLSRQNAGVAPSLSRPNVILPSDSLAIGV